MLISSLAPGFLFFFSLDEGEMVQVTTGSKKERE